jgi:glycogen(starch) synthase
MNRLAQFPRRTLMTADTVGGVWTYALELARGLGELGMEIVLATMGAPLNAAQRAEVRAIPRLDVRESNYKLEWMHEPWTDVDFAGDWLLELEDELHPDIVHLNGFTHGALPWRAPKIVVGHSCVLSWWRAVNRSEAPGEWKTYRDRVHDGLGLADLVIAPSHAMLAALTEYYGPFAASAVIPNGRRINLSRKRAKQNIVLAAGRLWDDAKNISALARVAPRLSWPVRIAGETRSPDGATMNHERLQYLGRLSGKEMARHFERAAIYALPARYEPFGLSILEAAFAGCALVLGDIASLRENWDGAAMFVPPGDDDALRSALEDLIAHPRRRAELAARARGRAAKFTREEMAQRYFGAYTDVLLRGPRIFEWQRETAHARAGALSDRKGAAACAL